MYLNRPQLYSLTAYRPEQWSPILRHDEVSQKSQLHQLLKWVRRRHTALCMALYQYGSLPWQLEGPVEHQGRLRGRSWLLDSFKQALKAMVDRWGKASSNSESKSINYSTCLDRPKVCAWLGLAYSMDCTLSLPSSFPIALLLVKNGFKVYTHQGRNTFCMSKKDYRVSG